MNLTNILLADTFSRSANRNRFVETSANLRVNSILLDFIVEKSADKNASLTSWDFLKAFNVNVALRLGSGNGSAVNLVHNVNAYQLEEYSDYKAGVSVSSTDWSENGMKRISGIINIGYFGMGSRDALEVNVDVDQSKIGNLDECQFRVSSVFKRVLPNTIYTYQSARPTGADQPYTNVLEVYYDSPTVFDGVASVKDKLGSQSVHLEDAIALANAEGNFEFFQRFGMLFKDQYDLSRDISFNVPVNENGDGEILIVGAAFYPDMLIENDGEDKSQRAAIVEQVKNDNPDKYRYLQLRGLVS